ncbi:YolD-like family protein [Oscillospiraceae bacterium Marseille-Q3528]|nr:YolD-like family protein [Oscillospiraceae bacterium Marseille-Q3528]
MDKKYAAIAGVPHHVSRVHPQMSMEDRAAQFSPFAALTGYGDVILETQRLTDEKVELDEEALALLNEKYQMLMRRMDEQPVVQITYFQPDERKEGGSYVTVTGVVRRVDDVMKKITMQDGNEIEMGKILNVEEVSYQDRVDIAKSLFGIISDDVTLEDAKEEQIKRW